MTRIAPSFQEGISDPDALYGLAVVQIFGEYDSAILRIRGGYNQGVPKREAVAFLDLACVHSK
jgi:hypothetical protein